MLRSRRESHHSNGITEHDCLQLTSATKSAKSRHSAPRQGTPLFDYLVGCGEERRAAESAQAALHIRFVPQADIRVDRSRRVCEGTGVSFVNCGSIDSSNKITDLRSRVPHTLTRGTFGTELPRGGVSLRRGPDGLRRGA